MSRVIARHRPCNRTVAGREGRNRGAGQLGELRAHGPVERGPNGRLVAPSRRDGGRGPHGPRQPTLAHEHAIVGQGARNLGPADQRPSLGRERQAEQLVLLLDLAGAEPRVR